MKLERIDYRVTFIHLSIYYTNQKLSKYFNLVISLILSNFLYRLWTFSIKHISMEVGVAQQKWQVQQSRITTLTLTMIESIPSSISTFTKSTLREITRKTRIISAKPLKGVQCLTMSFLRPAHSWMITSQEPIPVTTLRIIKLTLK